MQVFRFMGAVSMDLDGEALVWVLFGMGQVRPGLIVCKRLWASNGVCVSINITSRVINSFYI